MPAMGAGLVWSQLLAVAAGAAVGAVLRWWLGLALNPAWSGFALGTLAANCLGGLLIGLAMAWFTRTPNPGLQLLLVTGVLGGFTTFSAFSAESLTLLQRGAWALALLHSTAHVLGALLCTTLGWALGRGLWR